jgi:glycerol-3-phosphate dehydrogenase
VASNKERFDVIIIGGGINGAGIARDAALRGLKVLLLEARDFGSGTSSWSSRLIHGGLRYLEYGEIPLVYESLHERRYLRRLAGHLVKPLRLVIPLYKGGKRPPWMVRMGMIAYDALSVGKSLPGHSMLSAKELEKLAPGIDTIGLKGAASYYDAQVSFAERLVIENVIAAAQAGADVRNYSEVTALRPGKNGLHTLEFSAAGESGSASSTCIVNAAGPWVDQVLSRGVPGSERLMGGTKGSHIVVQPFSGAPADAFYVEAPSDGRPVFIIPWNDQYLIGTTDIRYDGDPADAAASRAEVDYLLATVNDIFPQADLQAKDISFSYAGVRPLPYVQAGPESAITRRHIIHRHKGDARGIWSIIGGKLTTYRNLAEQVVDRIERQLGGVVSNCTTANSPLPGGADPENARQDLDAIGGLPAALVERLLAIYGSRASRLAELCAAEPSLARIEAGRFIGAEVVLAIREEFARTLIDLMHRRLMLGLSADQGREVAAAVAAKAATELGWSKEEISRQLQLLDAYNQRLQPCD